MNELNRLLQLQYRAYRHNDKIALGPRTKVTEEVLKYTKSNKKKLLQQIDIRDSYFSTSGVGGQLERIIPNFFKKSGCNCTKEARAYDKMGIEWCEENKEEIINKLNKKASKYKLHILPTHTTIRIIVNLAIKKAKAAQSTYSPGNLFVGVTTAPRQQATLLDTLYSLKCNGLDPMIFAEPGSIPTVFPTKLNKKRLGAWFNWLSMARTALTYNVDHFLFVQDDIVLHQDSHSLIESQLGKIDGFLSLYTPPKYSRLKGIGIHRIYTKSLWGACALLFPRKILEDIVNHPRADTWLGARARNNPQSVYERRRKNPHQIANVDTAIGMLMNKFQHPMYFTTPSQQLI